MPANILGSSPNILGSRPAIEVLGSRPNAPKPAIEVLGSIICVSILGSIPADWSSLGSIWDRALRSIPASDAILGSIIAIILGSIIDIIVFMSIPAACSILGSICANILGSIPNIEGLRPPNMAAVELDIEVRGEAWEYEG